MTDIVRNLAFVCGFFIAISTNLHACVQEEEEVGIEEISLENWTAINESIMTYEAKLKIYRVRFKSETGFDVDHFQSEMKKADSSGKTDEYLAELFTEFYPTLKKPVPGLVWGETVDVAANANKERIRWYLSDNNLTLDYLFTPNAHLRRIVKLGQVQVSNASSMERFTAKHLIGLPVVKDSSDYIATEGESRICLLESKTSDKAIEFDTETMAVQKLINGEKYVRVNLAGVENAKIGHVIPSLFYEIQYKEGSLKRIKITKILDMKINEKIAEKKLSIPIGKGEVLVDSRGGLENTKVYSPAEDTEDAYAFLKGSGKNDADSSEDAMPEDGERNSDRELEKVPAAENAGRSGVSLSRDLFRMLTIVSIVLCISLFISRED